jgi:hypothetical protein
MFDLQLNVANPIPFVLVDNGGDEVADLGAAFTVAISKNGGAWAASAGTKAELGDGWYLYTTTAAECNTRGPLALKITADGAAQQNLLFTVATTPAASVALSDAALNELQSGNLALYTHYDWDFQIFSTSLEDLSTGDLYVGVKHLDTDTDAEALVLIERTAGLLYINQAAATTAGNATLVVTGTAGAWLITGHLAAVETAKLTAWKRRQLAEVKLSEKLIWTGHITISLGVVQS